MSTLTISPSFISPGATVWRPTWGGLEGPANPVRVEPIKLPDVEPAPAIPAAPVETPEPVRQARAESPPDPEPEPEPEPEPAPVPSTGPPPPRLPI